MKQIRLEDKEKERYLVRKGDLLICEGGDVGRAAIWESENPIYYQNALHRVRFYQNINQYFFIHLLNYYKNLGLIDDVSGGVTIKHFTQNSMQKLLFPLAPLNEQEKIVEEIDRIFSLIDSLDKDKEELQTAIKQTKSKILDLAIHGKLVAQDPSDEPASVLLKKLREEKEAKIKAGELKRDKNDSYIYKNATDNCHCEKFTNGTVHEIDVPFEIPESWSWSRLGSICDYGKCKNASTDELSEDSWILDLEDIEKDTGKILKIVHFKDRKSLSTKHVFNKGDLLYSKLRPYLNKVVIAPKDGFCTSEILPLDFNGVLSNEYGQHLFMSSYFLETVNFLTYGVKMPRLGTDDARKILIPLPPLAEQKRIVEKIENAFAKLDFIAEQLA